MTEHTELPELAVGYKDQGLGHGYYVVIRKESGELFANVPFGDKNLAEQVARACNAHKDLLALLSDILEWDGILPHSKTRITAAIAKAKE